MQQKQAGHAISLYFDLLLADEFVKPSIAPPASAFHEVEVAEIKLPLQVQEPVSKEQRARLVPLIKSSQMKYASKRRMLPS